LFIYIHARYLVSTHTKPAENEDDQKLHMYLAPAHRQFPDLLLTEPSMAVAT